MHLQKVKKYFVSVILCFILLKSQVSAQVPCSTVRAEAFAADPPQTTYVNWGVEVTLERTAYQDVVVSGTMRGPRSFKTFSVTVPAGSHTAQTTSYLRTNIGESVDVEVSSVTPCPLGLNEGIGGIIQNINSGVLQNLVAAQDSTGIVNYLSTAAYDMATYVYNKYALDLRDSALSDPLTMIATGMLIHAKELGVPAEVFDNEPLSFNVGKPNMLMLSSLIATAISQRNIYSNLAMFGNWKDCLWTAVGTIVGWKKVKKVYGDLLAMGVNVNTAWGAVKVIAKRAGFGITVGMALFEYIDCVAL